jgi:two-component system LytT family sensor kinase
MSTLTLRNVFRWHLLAWLVYSAYSLLGDFGGRQGEALRQAVWHTGSFAVANMVTFYAGYLLVYPRLLRVGRLPLLLLGLAGLTLLFAGVRAGLEEGLYPLLLGFHNYTPDTSVRHYLSNNAYFALPALVWSAALWAGEEALRRERLQQVLLGEKRVAEAAFLKMQLNPHFLHNTLNMLYGLAYGVDKTLAQAQLQLSELMHYMLRETPDGLVQLPAELDYIQNFLALYRLRYPGLFHVELTVSGDPAGYRLAPLLLIPFVENACKHGVLDAPATPVRLHLRLTPGLVEFTAKNTCHPYQADHTPGLGLANLRRRLELLYAGQYEVRAARVEAEFRAYLRLVIPAAAVTPALSTPAAGSPSSRRQATRPLSS